MRSDAQSSYVHATGDHPLIGSTIDVVAARAGKIQKCKIRETVAAWLGGDRSDRT